MKPILALDQGTTSSRAIIFDHEGNTLGMAQQEFTQRFPHSGWVEHNPLDIWSSQEATARKALAKANLDSSDLAAIGITNQRETTLLWERRSGRAISNAIVWQDRRTTKMCQELQAQGADALIAEKTGLRLDPYFSATKLQWMLDNIPGARKRAEKGELAFGTVDTWLLWNLTQGAVHATDPSNASRTLLYNIHQGCWDDELLKLFNIPRELLPKVKPSSGTFGECAAHSVAPGVPVAGIAGDQQSALFGQACLSPGMAKNTYGTGCFLLMNTGAQPIRSTNNLLTTIAWSLQPQAPKQQAPAITYALEGSVFIGGAVVQWLRDGLGLIKSAPEIEKLARTVDDAGGIYLVPAFAGLGAPHWDPTARGAILGLERGTTAGHIARAALEGMAFQVADLLAAMNADADVPLRELRVDGGASANDLLLQIQADLLQVPVVRPNCIETTALGTAFLAGLATGTYKDTQELTAHWREEHTFEPTITPDEAAARLQNWKNAVTRTQNWQT